MTSRQSTRKKPCIDVAFKSEAVRIVRTSGRSQREIAKDIGISISALSRWVRDEREKDLLSGPHDDQMQEIKRLRRERDLARQERDLLKKATAFFARESR